MSKFTLIQFFKYDQEVHTWVTENFSPNTRILMHVADIPSRDDYTFPLKDLPTTLDYNTIYEVSRPFRRLVIPDDLVGIFWYDESQFSRKITKLLDNEDIFNDKYETIIVTLVVGHYVYQKKTGPKPASRS